MWLLLAIVIAIPLGLDLYMPVPEDNPITLEKIELGRRLFHDRRLSRDQPISCASCHDPKRGFSDARPVAVGVFGRQGNRNVPAIINRGYGRAFFWDGHVDNLVGRRSSLLRSSRVTSRACVALDTDSISKT